MQTGRLCQETGSLSAWYWTERGPQGLSTRDWGISQLCRQPYLEVVEFIITKDLVVILVREVENPGQRSCTCRFQLQGTNHGDKNRAPPSTWPFLPPPETPCAEGFPSCTGWEHGPARPVPQPPWRRESEAGQPTGKFFPGPCPQWLLHGLEHEGFYPTTPPVLTDLSGLDILSWLH